MIALSRDREQIPRHAAEVSAQARSADETTAITTCVYNFPRNGFQDFTRSRIRQDPRTLGPLCDFSTSADLAGARFNLPTISTKSRLLAETTEARLLLSTSDLSIVARTIFVRTLTS